MSTRWYVVQTHAHAEAKAAAHLARQGFTAYLPRYLKRRRHARRIETVAAPLFPRYLFVTVDMVCQRWRSIRSTIGVTRLVCNGDDPIAGSRRRRRGAPGARGRARLRQAGQRPRFALGEKVRVLDGVFADCLGLFDGMKDSERVAVLLDLLGRKVRLGAR